ncbi:MAG: pantoate--beta-alanine ligase [Paludibacteraceae bacterium]|nr:pantoate--beta-alanine ligase [Paludibacteraceae bacterium]
MEIIKTKNKLQELVGKLKNNGKTIGLVPTMGALHEGHLQLIRRCAKENDVCIVSIFVNPTQFNDKNDLAKYPRTLEADAKLLEKNNCFAIFAPEVDEVYSSEELNSTFEFNFNGLDEVMEGKFRPGHFNGVVQIVGKLFELTTPDKAYFGEKDFQQLAIIRHLVATKSYPIEIIGCPIVREESGLALSSRNALLSESEKQIAINIYKTLLKSIDYQNEKSIKETIDWVITTINNIDGLCVEYFEIVDGKTLQSIQNWDDANYIVGCITVFCGTVRLIDNIQYK